MADREDETRGTTEFREAIARARREPVDVSPQFEPVAHADEADAVLAAVPPDPRWEMRVERLRGSRKRRARLLEELGGKRWQLVAVDGGYAYLRRPAR